MTEIIKKEEVVIKKVEEPVKPTKKLLLKSLKKSQNQL
jgi:hypothetical protein